MKSDRQVVCKVRHLKIVFNAILFLAGITMLAGLTFFLSPRAYPAGSALVALGLGGILGGGFATLMAVCNPEYKE